MTLKKFSVFASIALVNLIAPVSAEFDWKHHLGKVDFLTEYYFLQDMHHYFGHKNSVQDTTYLVSGYSEIEVMFVSYDSLFHIGAMYSNYLGMGKQNEAIMFDPRDANYAIVPFFEYRHRGIVYQLGLDHRCYHQIDRLPIPMTMYWNKPYLKVSSANFRFQQMQRDYLANEKFGHLDRFKWQATAGYFIWKFGDTDESILSGGHTWGSVFSADIGYSAYKTKSWIFSVNHKLTAHIDTTGTGYWSGLFAIDADVYNRKNSLGFFLNYNYEFPRELPRNGRDKLWSWGFRVRV